MKYPLYNQQGKEEGIITLPKEIFDIPLNVDLVHQVLVSQNANKRQVSAHTKDRSEVKGGGRKPWRQKGTGRARHGSTRSPLWKGGGVTFGPRNEKVYHRDIPKKMRKIAICMVLSEKARNKLLVVLDELKPFDNAQSKPKTKIMAEIIRKLPIKNDSRLVLYKDEKGIYLASRNIARTGVLEARNLNIANLMNYKYLLTTKEGIKEIESTFSTKK
jgi:large subunit ribosomal protein L4